MPHSIRALIVDDERLARNEMRRLLAAHGEIEIVGEARDAAEARAMIADLNPGLLLLDIQMPGASGFELLEQLDEVPAVIFSTAYDQYAIQAFEVSAIDYLLKPVTAERLAAALGRLPRAHSPSLPAGMNDQVFVRDGERCWFVRLSDVVLLESEGNYTRLYFGSARPLLQRSLNYLESRLDPAVFFRASRQHILNLRHIVSLDPWANGGLIVKMDNGQTSAMSRRRAQMFKELKSL